MDEVAALLGQLVEDPEDPALLAVLGDLLESRGDPRGELIAMQLGIKQSSVADAVAIGRRREQLVDHLTPVLIPVLRGEGFARDKFTWGIGYVKGFELAARSGANDPARWLGDREGREVIAEALAELWAHPSMALLAELGATTIGAISVLAQHPPVTVSSLVIGRGSPADIEALADLVSRLPRLARLRVIGDTELERLSHPTLATVAIDAYETIDALRGLARAELPALTRLSTRHANHKREPLDGVVAELARGTLLARLTHLTLSDGELTPAGVAALAAGLGTRRLARLELGERDPVPRAITDALAPLADELVAHTVAETPNEVDHANKPEWGRGTIVRRYDGKVEIDFPHAGTKVFKANAAFLRYV